MDPYKRINAKKYKFPERENWPIQPSGNPSGTHLTIGQLATQAAFLILYSLPNDLPVSMTEGASVKGEPSLGGTATMNEVQIGLTPECPASLKNVQLPTRDMEWDIWRWGTGVDDWSENPITDLVAKFVGPIIRSMLYVVGMIGSVETQRPVKNPLVVDLLVRVLPLDGEEPCDWNMELKNINCSSWGGWGLMEATILSGSQGGTIRGVMTESSRHAESINERQAPTQPPLMSVIGVAPTRLNCLFWDFEGQKVGISSNAMAPIDGTMNDEQHKLAAVDGARWGHFIETMIFIVFAWLVREVPEFKDRWLNKFPTCLDAVTQAEALYTTAGRALATEPFFAPHTRKLTSLAFMTWQRLSTVALKALPLGLVLRLTQAISTIPGRSGLKVDFGARWAPLLGCLDAPDVHGTDRPIYTFSRPSMVWKIFPVSDELAYTTERDFYDEFASMQNDIIPVLYASGRLEDGRFVLVLSNVGQLRPMASPDQRTKNSAKNMIDRLHEVGWHHHDLWDGNIVGGDDGRLKLIDFESVTKAEKCPLAEESPDKQFTAQYCN